MKNEVDIRRVEGERISFDEDRKEEREKMAGAA